MIRKKRIFSPEKLAELKILRQLLGSSIDDYKIRAREWKIFNKLRKIYYPLDFWSSLRPALPIQTLAYFLSEFGAQSLHLEWKDYIIRLAIQKSEEDKAQERRIEMLERLVAQEELDKNQEDLDKNLKEETIELVPKKQTMFEWMDS